MNTSDLAPICDLHVWRMILLRDAQIQGVRSPTRHTFSTVASNIGGPTVRNSGHVTYMAPWILRRLLGFRWNLCTPNFAEFKAGVEALLNERGTLETFITQNISDQMEVIKMASDQMEVIKMARDQMEVIKMASDQMEVIKMASDQMEVIKMASDQMEVIKMARDQMEVIKMARDQMEVIKMASDQNGKAANR